MSLNVIDQGIDTGNGTGSIIAIVGVLLTFAIFLINVVYRTGHLSARVEEIERWRQSIRQDMHEISSKLGKVDETLKYLATLIEERTERRRQERESERG